jgi:FKBP12-rapamycin complex-associated protein
VRLCALTSLEDAFSVHMAQPENLNALVLALSDESLEIRETAVTLLAKLSVINPAYVHPLLRKTLLRVSAMIFWCQFRCFAVSDKNLPQD